MGLDLSLSGLLLIGAFASLVSHQALATTSNPIAVIDPTKDVATQLITNPPTLTTQQEADAKAIALSNNEVQKAVFGKSYKFEGTGLMVNIHDSPIKWYPVVTISVADKTGISAIVDLDTRSVMNIQHYQTTRIGPMSNSGTSNGALSTQSASAPSYSTDVYKGTTNPIEMFMSTQNGAPTYTPSAASMDGQVDFLLNAVEYQASYASCTPSDVYANYFAQVGFDYPSVGQAQVIYADTLSSCNTVALNLAYTPGHLYIFKIHAYNNPVSWRMIGQDVSPDPSRMRTPSDGHFFTPEIGGSAYAGW
jgi:hypothetical protein